MAEQHSSAKELREIPVGELQTQLQSLRQELWTQRVKAKEGLLQQSHRVGLLRRQIARLSTVLNERQATQQPVKAS